MYYRKLVEDAYFEAIALNNTIPYDLRVALKNHGKIPLFLHNLAVELDKTQAKRIADGKATFAVKQLKNIVYDFTKLFIEGVKAEAESRHQSDIKKQLMQAKLQAEKDLDLTASGKVSGDYVEIFKDGGVIATDERTI